MHWSMDSPEQTLGWRSTCELVLGHLSSAPRLVVVHWTLDLDPNTYGQVWRRGFRAYILEAVPATSRLNMV